MADRYFVNGGVDNNWGTTGNWSTTSGGAGGSSVPTASDAVFFDANSPNVDVNASARVALSLDFTGYSNTITMSQNITVSGSVTLAAAMGIAGSSTLIVAAASTLTSNGKAWSTPMTIQGAVTHAIVGTWTNTALTTLGNGTVTTTINSANTAHELVMQDGLSIGGTSPVILGTTKMVLDGTGTLTGSSATGSLRNDLEFRSGTITLSGGFDYHTGTLSYTGGTVITTGGSLNVGASTTFDCAGITWDTLVISSQSVLTLTSDLSYGSSLQLGSGSNNLTFNTTTGSVLTGSANVTTNTTGTISGTSKLKITSGGTFTRSQTSSFSLPIEIDAPGETITFSGICELQVGGWLVTDCAGIVTDAGTWKTFGAGGTDNFAQGVMIGQQIARAIG